MSFFAIVFLLLPYLHLFENGHFNVEAAEIRPFIVYTNATKLFVGDTLTMGCELPAGYKYLNYNYNMYFLAFSKIFAYYNLPGKNRNLKYRLQQFVFILINL